MQSARSESATKQAVAQRQRAPEQEQQAQQRLAALYTEKGRQELLHGSTSKAMVYLSAAYEVASQAREEGLELRMLLANAMRSVDVISLDGYTGVGFSVQFSADGTHMVTDSRDGAAQVWEVATGRLLISLEGRPVQFSADGTRMVTDSRDGGPHRSGK